MTQQSDIQMRRRDLRAAVRTRLEAESGAIFELIEQLVAIPAPNPPGDTTRISRSATRYLETAGLPVKVYSCEPSKPNLVSLIGGAKGPRVILCAHMDTFPPPALRPDEEPYRVRVEDDRVYGTGVGDMRAGLAIALTLTRILAEQDISLLGGVCLVCTSDEERGGRAGAGFLLREAHELGGAMACLIADQSGVAAVGAAEKGFCWLRLTTTTEQGHAAYTEGEAAIARLLEAIRIANSLRSLRRSAGVNVHGISESPLATRVTMNVGRIEGGVAPNLSARSASADLDIRIPVGMSVDDIVSTLRRRLNERDVRVDVEILEAGEPTVTPPTEHVVAVCAASVERVTGRAADVTVRVGASDARHFREHGIPAVVCGPKAHNLAGTDEFVERGEIMDVARVHAEVVMDLLESSGTSETPTQASAGRSRRVSRKGNRVSGEGA